MKIQRWLYWLILVMGVLYRAVIKAPRIAGESREAWLSVQEAWLLLARMEIYDDLNAEEKARLKGYVKEMKDVFEVVVEVFCPGVLAESVPRRKG